MTKHTPGPWRVGKDNCVVADSNVGTHSSPDDVKCYGGNLVCELIKTEANAKLIAKAPELLAVAKLHLVQLGEMVASAHFSAASAEAQLAVYKHLHKVAALVAEADPSIGKE